jgi:NDP-sugar pyrophosphorylase family protein
MNLIFCMAGLYRRFREAGYTEPKFLLPWHNATVLHHIVGELSRSEAFDQILLVANRRDRPYRDRILAELGPLGIGEERLVFVGDTDGQAATASTGIDLLDAIAAPADRRVVFHNIDTLVCGRDLRAVAALLQRCDGWIDTFTSADPAFSYVRCDDRDRVIEIAEKRVISDRATTGLYAFANADDFRRAVAHEDAGSGERYISDVYRSMIVDGKWIEAGCSRPEDTLIFGTPSQYEHLIAAT